MCHREKTNFIYSSVWHFRDTRLYIVKAALKRRNNMKKLLIALKGWWKFHQSFLFMR